MYRDEKGILWLCGRERVREDVCRVFAGVHSSQRYLYHLQEIEVRLCAFPQMSKYRDTTMFNSQPE